MHIAEFSTTVDLFDSSNYQSSTAFKVNCFTKRYVAWLPHPEIGDVIVMRDVRVIVCHLSSKSVLTTFMSIGSGSPRGH